MSVQFIRISILAAATIQAIGCAPQGAAIRTQAFSNNPPQSITLKYAATYGDGSAVNNSAICGAIRNEIATKSAIKDKYEYNYKSNISNITGKTVEFKQPCEITVSYLNGEHYFSSRRETYTSQVVAIPVAFTLEGKYIIASMQLTNTATIYNGNNAFFIPYAPALNDVSLTNEINRFSKIAPVLHKFIEYSGEFDSSFPDNSVFANYKRLLTESKQTSEDTKDVIGKYGYFNFNTGKNESDLYIQVYPYKNGSKIKYKFNLKHQLNPDGTSTYDAGEAEGMLKKIRDIANS